MEEPVWDEEKETISIKKVSENIWIIVPYLSSNIDSQILLSRKEAVDYLIEEMQIDNYIFWYYSPMALPFSDHVNPALIVYDCMDELSSFKNAPAALKENENKLIQKADIMFMGGYSLYHAKKNIYIIMLMLFQAALIRNIFLQREQKLLKKIFMKISLILGLVFMALLMNE